MVREICVLPVKCKRCNSIFDLWYDLEEQNASLAVVLEDREMEQYLNQSFCWRCRQAVKKSFESEDDEDGGDEVPTEEYELGFE